MTDSDFLKLQIRLLVAQFGRKAILEVVASDLGTSPEQLAVEIDNIKAKKRSKTLKRDKTLEEILHGFLDLPEERRDLVAKIGHLYETKQFLPNLRDAQDFLHRSGLPTRKFKSRKTAFSAVLKVVSQGPVSELQSLIAHVTSSPGQSEYALLANQLMGKGR